METPDKIFGPLFAAVQLSDIFEDSKTFADCIPQSDPATIVHSYLNLSEDPAFDLTEFVKGNFALPEKREFHFQPNTDHNIHQHIGSLWHILTRRSDQAVKGSSLIPLPKPYIVPGGRFREIYYWDSYFTMLGLAASNRIESVSHMVDNFAYLIRTIGHIPNGNRTYFMSRSQPPFFSQMVNLLAQLKSDDVLITYLPDLEMEYKYWMDGTQKLSTTHQAYRRVVLIGDTSLNRYFDDNPVPRQESYKEDITLLEKSGRNAADLFLNIRAACESGWDFSSRWCADAFDLSTIHTTDIVPVDLNVLLWLLETALVKAYRYKQKLADAEIVENNATKRASSIRKLCWDTEKGYFFDYDFRKRERTSSIHAGGLFPIYAGMATEDEARRSAVFAENHLLQPGGLNTTDLQTGQQWDAPNGWAPLQWIAYTGFNKYGLSAFASELSDRWTGLNERVFRESGKLVEKYNVMDDNLEAGGGEYPLQDGFGWTNGVYMGLKKLVSK